MSVGRLVDFEQLDEQAKQLIEEASVARNFSYSPYSKFKVGSALRCTDSSIQRGCNVENASYSAAICAERCALVKAVSKGHTNFHSVSVIAERIDGRLTTPCGVCRQMLSEFGDFPVYVTDPRTKEVLVTSTHELLPHAFNPSTKDFSTSSSKD